MPNFFRSLREKSASKTRFYKYLLYAIGEVFLIVVGILVAVSIGNWNDDRKNLQAVDKIAATICDDLLRDISQFDFLLKRHYQLDSLLQKVTDGALTEQDYRNDWPLLNPLIVQSYGFYAHKNGYAALQTIVDDIPDDFHRITGDLTDYQVFTISDAVYALEREDRLVWQTIEDWEKYDWNYLRRSRLNPARMDYLLHSSEYKNKAMTFLTSTRNIINLFEVGRRDAFNLYLELSRYRGVPIDSTFDALRNSMDIGTPITLISCDSLDTGKEQSFGAIKSIGLFKNSSNRSMKIIVSGDDHAEHVTEIPAASVISFEFSKGEVIKMMDHENKCLGYYKVLTANFVIE